MMQEKTVHIGNKKLAGCDAVDLVLLLITDKCQCFKGSFGEGFGMVKPNM